MNPVSNLVRQKREAASLVNSAKMTGNTHGTGQDAIDWSYKDRLTVPTLAGTDSLFTSIAGKNLSATNMTIPSAIPKGEKLRIWNIKVFYTGITQKAAADVVTFFKVLAGTVVEFIVQPNKTLGQWTLQELLGIPILLPVLDVTVNNTNHFPDPLYNGNFPLNKEIELGENTNFQLKVTYFNAPGAVLAGDYLDIALAGERYYVT
jgi:hypothetical protein